MYVKNQLHPTGTLSKTFHKPAGEANTYVKFGYVPQKICNHNQGQFSVAMKSDSIKEQLTALI